MILIGFVARDRFADEDVDLALHEIVHDQLLAGELFIEVEDIGDVTVWILQRHHPVLREWRGRRRGWDAGQPPEAEALAGRLAGSVGGGGSLGLAETGIDRCERQRRDAEKP